MENGSVSINGKCNQSEVATQEFHKEVEKSERGEKKRDQKNNLSNHATDYLASGCSDVDVLNDRDYSNTTKSICSIFSITIMDCKFFRTKIKECRWQSIKHSEKMNTLNVP